MVSFLGAGASLVGNPDLLLLSLSILLPKENKQISIKINDHDKLEWWTRFNNNGLNFTQSNFSLSYKNIFDNYELLINTHGSSEKIIFGESYISFLLADEYKIKFGKYYRDYSTYLNNELSSGSMLIGMNALPIPKIGLLSEYKIKKNNKLKKIELKMIIDECARYRNEII